jgi:hypothetical protein
MVFATGGDSVDSPDSAHGLKNSGPVLGRDSSTETLICSASIVLRAPDSDDWANTFVTEDPTATDGTDRVYRGPGHGLFLSTTPLAQGEASKISSIAMSWSLLFSDGPLRARSSLAADLASAA